MLFPFIAASTGLLAFLSFTLGIFSLVRNPKSKTIQLWFALCVAVTIWTTGYILTITSPDNQIAAVMIRVVYFGASLIPILFFHFITSFLHKNRQFRAAIGVGYILAPIFVLLTSGTNLLISGVRYMPDFGQYEEIVLPAFYFFLAYFFFYAIFAITLLCRDYRFADGIRRRQIFYLIFASAVGFVGGSSNFVTDLTGIYPYGQLIVWLYPILITYGIFMGEVRVKFRF